MKKKLLPRIKLKFPKVEWWGIFTIICMMGYVIAKESHMIPIIQIASTIFLFGGFIRIVYVEEK